jgi:hypothetical protein
MKSIRFFYTLCIVSLALVCAPYTVFGFGEQIKITEIMYDLEGTDTDREWIEVHNETGTEIDLTGWKFYDGSNHVLNIPPANGGQGSLALPAGGFLIITQNAGAFFTDHPGYAGTVIDSVVSLANTGDTIRMINATNVVADEVTYTSVIGATGDGNSLSWYESGWIATVPSPGETAQAPTPPGGGGGNNNPPSNPPVVKPTVFLDSEKEPVWTATLTPSMPTIFSHVPFTLTTLVKNPKKQEYQAGRFVYTLGDGRIIDVTKNTPLQLEYQESGSYVLYFEFYNSKSDVTPVVTDQLLLSVEDAPILLSLDETPTYKITLSNLYSGTINISGWTLKDGIGHSLVFPKNTFLPGKREMTLNSAIHTLSGKTLSLITPTGHSVALYPSPVSVEKKLVGVTTSTVPIAQASQAIFSESVAVDPSLVYPNNSTYIPDDEKSIQSELSANSIKTPLGAVDMATLLFIGFAIVVGLAMYLTLRKEKITPLDSEIVKNTDISSEADEYQIVEIEDTSQKK